MLTGDSEQLRACASVRTLATDLQQKFSNFTVQRGGRSASTLLIASLLLGVSSAAVLRRRRQPNIGRPGSERGADEEARCHGTAHAGA